MPRKNTLTGRNQKHRVSQAVRAAMFRIESLETRVLLSAGPVVESINRLSPNNNVAGSAPLTFRATFSEDVTGVDPTDFQVVATGDATASPTVSIAPQSGSVYDVTVTDVAGPGAVRLDLVNDRSIHDSAGQTLIGANDTLHFEEPIDVHLTGSGDSGRALATGDFNNDGKPDFIVATSNGDGADVYLGKRVDGFTLPMPLTSPLTGPLNAAQIFTADVNGDGNLDVIIPQTGNILVFAGQGDGHFGMPVAFVATADSSTPTVADFNHDGRPDVAVVSAADGNVRIFSGNATTLLSGPTTVNVGTGSNQVAAGDFNGDGNADLVVSDSTNTVHVFYGDGHGNFSAGPSAATESPSLPISLAAFDATGDGISDVVVTADLFGVPGSVVDVIAGSSDGTLKQLVRNPSLQTDSPLVSADLNGDGLPDIVQANGLGFSVLTNVGNATFKSTQDLANVELADGIAIADFNHDGVADVLLTSDQSPNATLLLSQGASFVGETYTVLPPIRVTAIDRQTPDAATSSEGSVTYHVQFSTLVKGIGAADFNVTTTGTVETGNISVSAAQGSAVDVTINGVHGNGTLQLSLVDNNSITDLDSNPLGTGQPGGGSFVGQTYSISQVLPRVIGINREAPLSPTIGNQPVTYQVLFSTAVTGVDAADFQVLTTGDVAYGSPLVVAGSGQVYTVTVNGVTGGGSLTLKLKDNGSIHDLLGNKLADPGNQASFDAATVSAIPGPVLGVSTADFNGDGLPDRISINANSIYVEPGNGDGTFGPAIRTFSSYSLTAFAIEDFNHDGNLDVAAVGNGGVFLFPGLGDDTFAPPIVSATGLATPVEIHAADFNGDGTTDLLVTSNFQGDVVLLGNGQGRFTFNNTFIVAGPNVAIVDFNNDGVPDIQGTGTYQNDGQGNFFPADADAVGTPLPATFPTSSITATGDLNGDGIADQVSVDTRALAIDVVFGQANGSLGEGTSYDVGSSVSQVVLSDVNNDGQLDITAIVPGGVTTLLNKGAGVFSAPESIADTFAIAPVSVTTADFNHDGRADLIVTGLQQDTTGGTDFYAGMQIYLANPDGSYAAMPINDVVRNDNTIASSATVADINGDGIPDVIVSVHGVDAGDGLLVFLGSTDDGVTLASRIDVDAGHVAIADFNGDGYPDIVTGQAQILDGNGDGTFQPARQLTGLPAAMNVSTADLNNDGRPDLIFDGSSVDVALGNGNDTFQPAVHLTSTTSFHPLRVKTADMNQDGIPDLIVASPDTRDQISIYLGNGNGTYAAPHTFFTGDTTSFDVGDVNGDGIPDIVTSNDATFVSLGIGDGSVAPPVTYAPAGLITLADANGDGKNDILFVHRMVNIGGGSPTENLSGVGVIFNNAAGDFVGDTYRVIRTSDVITGSGGNDAITLFQDPDHIHIDWTTDADSGQLAINDPAGLTILGNGGIDQINLNYAYGDPLPLKMVLNGQFDLNNLQTTDNLAGRTIDIGGSKVWVTYSGAASDPVDALRGYLRTGFNNRTWSGSGSSAGGAIVSSTAAHDLAHTGVGYLDSASGINPNQPANTVLLQAALYGDLNLDGIVNSSEAATVTQHLGMTNARWSDGDFNYDGTVDAADIALLSANFTQPAAAPVRPTRVTALPPPVGLLSDTPAALSSDSTQTKTAKQLKAAAKELKVDVKAAKKAAKVEAKKKH